MNSGFFYGRGSSLTTSLAASGISPAVVHTTSPETDGGYLGHSVNSTDQSLAINQKLDGLLALFMEQKAESRAENADLKKQISILGSEVSELKRRIDTASSSSSGKRRIPRDLSVRVFHCVSVPHLMKVLFFVGGSKDNT